ncbi:hypothetical protein L2E82_10694 [Cichorium intybus]|uniref:Uncharacterized protein n=1 Tax=Cichorium intybus TaxID=13427 RepID=A0ACB9GCA6_CICIN|nr:hypothetical protein L2E82_10694 [Cichorium intybus]
MEVQIGKLKFDVRVSEVDEVSVIPFQKSFFDCNSVKDEEEGSSGEEDQFMESDFEQSENFSDEDGDQSFGDGFGNASIPQKVVGENNGVAVEIHDENDMDENNLENVFTIEGGNGNSLEEVKENSETGIKDTFENNTNFSPSPSSVEKSSSPKEKDGLIEDDLKDQNGADLSCNGLDGFDQDENNPNLIGVYDKLKAFLSKKTPIKEKLKAVEEEAKVEMEKTKPNQKEMKMEKRLLEAKVDNHKGILLAIRDMSKFVEK